MGFRHALNNPRHMDVTMCTIGSIAFTFFWRYHIRGEPWPDFSVASNWYDYSTGMIITFCGKGSIHLKA